VASVRDFQRTGLPACRFRRLTLLTAVVLCHAVSLFALEWGASATETYADTRSDTTHTGTFDQQYQFHANGDVLPALSYFSSLTYHHVRSSLGNGTTWQSEMLPSVSAVWSAPFFRVRSDYTYRDNRDQLNITRLTGRSADVNVQTDWASLPRLTGRYEWRQNVNDLELLGVDTRQRTIGGAADYSFSSTTLRYEYNDLRTENHRTGLAQTSRSHTGRFENTLSALNNLVSVQSSYMVVFKNQREQRASDEGILIPLTPVSGLWAVNPTPEVGTLNPFASLIDGNFDSAASVQMNLSGSDIQNFGMDFGSSVRVDHIFLYTDSLANADLRWSVYTSADNSNWTSIQGPRAFPFNVVFRRYEMTFPAQVTRYIKLVVEPQPAQIPVYVTEIRGLQTRDQSTGRRWATDHMAAVHVGIQPAKWLSGSVEGTLNRNGASATTISRQQDGLNGALQFSPARLLHLSGMYQLGRTEYSDVAGGKTDTELLGFTLISQWLSSIRTTVAGSRQKEVLANRLSRRLDGGSVRLDAEYLPGLTGTTDGGLTEDHRFLGADLYKTRYIGQNVQAQPVERLQFTADYRYYWLTSERAWTPPNRENITLQGTFRLTETLQISGEASRFREPGKIYETWQGFLNWNATEKLVLSTSAERTLPDKGGNTLLLTAQGIFRWTERSDISASYSHLDSRQSGLENFSNLRFGFTFRI
jgi:hypothetical protein